MDGVAFSNTLRFPRGAGASLTRTGGTNDGIQNTLIGSNAGSTLTTGYSNVFVGRHAGSGCVGGFQNVIIGRVTGVGNAFLHYNVAIGAATSLVAGSNQILIGYGLTSRGEGTITIGGNGNLAGTYIAGIRQYASPASRVVTVADDNRLGSRPIEDIVG